MNPIRLLSLSLAFAAALAGCTIVAPGGKDGGNKVVPVLIKPDALPPPKSLQASVLYVANLQRSSANLSGQYANIMIGVAAYLKKVGLELSTMGMIATYADTFGPRLLLGRTEGNQPGQSLPLLAALAAAAADGGTTDYATLLPLLSGALSNISDDELAVALKLLASSGRFDGDDETSEAKNVIRFGRAVDLLALPPQLGGIDRSALFDKPRDLFIVVYLQPLARRCAFGSAECLVDGWAPSDLFTLTNDDGTLAWLSFQNGGIRPEQVIQVSIGTSEGENLDVFRKRCEKVPGFPRNLFDVMAPSPNAYFKPLMDTLNGANNGTGHQGDFCELIGTSPEDAIKKLGNKIAAAVGTR